MTTGHLHCLPFEGPHGTWFQYSKQSQHWTGQDCQQSQCLAGQDCQQSQCLTDRTVSVSKANASQDRIVISPCGGGGQLYNSISWPTYSAFCCHLSAMPYTLMSPLDGVKEILHTCHHQPRIYILRMTRTVVKVGNHFGATEKCRFMHPACYGITMQLSFNTLVVDFWPSVLSPPIFFIPFLLPCRKLKRTRSTVNFPSLITTNTTVNSFAVVTNLTCSAQELTEMKSSHYSPGQEMDPFSLVPTESELVQTLTHFDSS